jgi:hypothetical protein
VLRLAVFSGILALWALLGGNISTLESSAAKTTPYKSAGTITTDGNPSYTNLSNCSVTDGFTCDRELDPVLRTV